MNARPFARVPSTTTPTRRGRRIAQRRGRQRRGVAGIAILTATALTLLGVVALPTSAALGPVGNGFVVTPGDLGFILKQINIAERHATTYSAAQPCSTLLDRPGDAVVDKDTVPDILTSYGLRTVDGSCNNLKTGDEYFAAADQTFPRLTAPVWRKSAPGGFPVPSDPSYQGTGNVVDTQPRLVSNLIVDQTSSNPAAVAASGRPVRSQNPAASSTPCTTNPSDTPTVVMADPPGCTPSHQTLFIPNVTTDVGLSPPYNSLFTFFGQFFDHGVDQTVKSGSAVFVPLQTDDPLIAGPDHVLGTPDDLPPHLRFMVLTRAQNQPGAVQDATNTDTPWVDQSQTYTSHASHQVFLREYVAGTGTFDASTPAAVATGKLLTGLPAGQTYDGSPDMQGGESTWASVKKQAAERLGLLLKDTDVTNIPMLATDPYGKYIPGPHGLPQYVTASGLIEGDLLAPVAVPANTLHFDTPFLTDIAHNADPGTVGPCTSALGVTPRVPSGCLTPDEDLTPSADFANQPAGTYDDEMLNAHAACGDGRCNENIALTTIHMIFHNEHNRLVDDISSTLDANPTLKAAYQAVGWTGADTHLGTGGYGYGERLFQAARFVTEMEYQHLVFEEFARKVQPAVRPFHVYSPDVNPAIAAEFAHAVYRFGHSMLNDTVARTVNHPVTGVPTDTSLPLLTAFLNPPALYDGGPTGVLSASAGGGSVVMGSSDQTGNELDEFVTETLRNNLLGLPLDLATLNMARAREAGVPPLNNLRRQLYAQTNDGALAPYGSWSEFGQHLKHAESLVNFVAAYGKHPTILAATTPAAKRLAARAIVDPFPGAAATPTTPAIPADVIPADAVDFMYGTNGTTPACPTACDWSNDANGATTTGLDDVDLWMGGLAEVTNLFGGLLGSTFNYVFQLQLEKLQDGDRLYYLARTPGTNLRTQLEGNSFSEMIQRNLDGTNTLKADAFATADCKFQLANDAGTPAGYAQFGATVHDDPATDCDESVLLLRLPDGTLKYRQVNPIDPPGINGQSVYQGSIGNDRIYGGNDNDTIWGGPGNDRIEGNGGDDVALGGLGDDIITDLDGADVPKGGPGNDAIDAGPGNDIVMGNEGQDFLNAGAGDNETFAGPGNDFIIAGQGADAVFGDGGDDWIQGGTGQDLLQGDHGAPFFDDPGEPAPGNDIFIGQPGENDYDAEGGDDIMAQNAAVDRNAGAGGFDWAIHQYNTIAANDDMMINNNLGGLPIQLIVNRDRWQETEADSGGKFNDVMLGTDGVLATPRLITGGGFTGCDALDQAGVARIKGLDALLPPVSTWVGTASAVAALSASGHCPLTGPVWGEGDILIGGTGSDTFTGRAGNEIIDGDRSLEVHISVRTNRDDPATELGRTDLMEAKATSGDFGPGTANMTLQQAVFAGLVNPGQLMAVREIVTPVVGAADCGAVTATNCDTAVFAGASTAYTISAHPAVGATAAYITVDSNGGTDGVDTVRNVEQLRFTDRTVSVATPQTPVIGLATAGDRTATVTWTPAADVAGVTSYNVAVFAAGQPAGVLTGISRTATSRLVTGLTNGTVYTFQVQAVNDFGPGAFSALSNAVTPSGAPLAPTGLVATVGNASADLTWVEAGSNGSPITGYKVTVHQVTPAGPADTVVAVPGPTTAHITGLTNGRTYSFRVQAVSGTVDGLLSAASNTVVPVDPNAATAPGAPTNLSAARGNTLALLTWSSPASNGGSPITNFRVTIASAGIATTTRLVGGAVNIFTVGGLVNGRTYTFSIAAINAVGTSAASSTTTATPATVPSVPVNVRGRPGPTGNPITAQITWATPANNGGSPITSYTVQGFLVGGGTTPAVTFAGIDPAVRILLPTLPIGLYVFRVSAVNDVGTGPSAATLPLVPR